MQIFFKSELNPGVFPALNQTFSNNHPETLPEWRTIFKASPGNKIITADYSQIELRILAQVSQDKEYIQAYKEGIDLHSAYSLKDIQEAYRLK